MTQSRARMLIEEHIERIYRRKPWGIEVEQLILDDFFEWSIKMHGLPKSIWAGAIFILYVKFDEYYNDKPPTICFHTIPFHPNVDMYTGKPGLPYLQDLNQWNSNIDLETILVDIQNILAEPDFDNVVNKDAVVMIQQSPDTFKEIVNHCIEQSRKIVGATHLSQLHSKEFEHKVVIERAPVVEGKSKQPGVCKVSFEDYYSTWKGIATSMASERDTNPFEDMLAKKEVLQRIHYGQTFRELKFEEADIDKNVKDLCNRGGPKIYKTQQKQKLEKLKQMKAKYNPSNKSLNCAADVIEENPNEIDDLLKWTDDLDSDNL